MKRRKKIWIACAALAVVVALCAFALTYQPVPYQFLKGATPDRDESSLRGYSPRGAPTRRVQAYRVSGTFEEVTSEARKELTPTKGWIRHASGDFPTLMLARGETLVEIYAAEQVSNLRTPETIVVVVGPTSLVDRFLNWVRAL